MSAFQKSFQLLFMMILKKFIDRVQVYAIDTLL